MALETMKNKALVHGISIEGRELRFRLQEGPIKENGVNGCQVTDLIDVSLHIIKELNKKFPCRENSLTIIKLEEALMWQDARTKDRENRGVEGTSSK